MMLLDQGPVECVSDAVVRCTSPGSMRSGLVKCPVETCPSKFGERSHCARIDQESIGPLSMSQRFSSGSWPWKPLRARSSAPRRAPTVSTLDAMCVESCK